MPAIIARSILRHSTARSIVAAAAMAWVTLLGTPNAMAQGLPPLAKELVPAQTALILIDFNIRSPIPMVEIIAPSKRSLKKSTCSTERSNW